MGRNRWTLLLRSMNKKVGQIIKARDNWSNYSLWKNLKVIEVIVKAALYKLPLFKSFFVKILYIISLTIQKMICGLSLLYYSVLNSWYSFCTSFSVVFECMNIVTVVMLLW